MRSVTVSRKHKLVFDIEMSFYYWKRIADCYTSQPFYEKKAAIDALKNNEIDWAE
jgi:hypothetical protein